MLRYDTSKVRSGELVLMDSGRNSQMTVRRYWDDKRSELNQVRMNEICSTSSTLAMSKLRNTELELVTTNNANE